MEDHTANEGQLRIKAGWSVFWIYKEIFPDKEKHMCRIIVKSNTKHFFLIKIDVNSFFFIIEDTSTVILKQKLFNYLEN